MSRDQSPDDGCPHGLTPNTCTYCKDRNSRSVFFSGGGMRYHYDRDCPKFWEGRQQVLDRGGVNAPVESGPEHSVSKRLDPCRTCVS